MNGIFIKYKKKNARKKKKKHLLNLCKVSVDHHFLNFFF